MTEACKRLRANKPLEGKECGWCGLPLVFGDDVALCQACDTVTHAACWDHRRGCSKQGCVNAPLKEVEAVAPVPAQEALPANMMVCPHCGKLISADSSLCDYCKMVPTPDGIYRGPKMIAPHARAAMWWGIAGLFICGPVFGAIAISKSTKAKQAIEADPRLGGQGYATAGRVLGIIDIAVFVLALLLRLGQL